MKRWYQSKTLCINALIVLTAVISVLQESPIVAINPEIWALITALINIPLRLITKEGLK